MNERRPFDLRAYVHDIGTRPCFICGLVRNDPDFFHHRVFEDDETIIFLSKYPTLPGYCLVCPREHREDLARDMSTDEYRRLQENVHILSRALKSVFDAERIYVLSLGSQQANSHLHFHVVPLPSGVPLEEQQYHALMAEYGVLQIPDDQMAQLAQRIAEAYRSELTAR
ncbi:HIT family protein (plasmid) [Rhizobium leguminosarum]|uniref:HIT family protein n=1 Tax=Rhizobium leguminosarum TaxID=384 RepID=UPI0010312F9A|nr:HIT family protein [Rhizobium leguminosarum]NKK88545.1 HIT domain-containing protein [Rhizobium leguminosarum bv. viciae]QIO75119.1 HIT family protein [Rhizobium leguminosarum bv. trifolii]QIO82134.1 HIT family protein [Rhizobium leguminosarum bv. trifolii]TAU91790.1 HIT family protein [Rhizobium leguminosarum]TAV00766.1 HIT family protein [Rhizobium leguminosarum]